MTATAERTNRDNLLAMLDQGYPVAPIRFMITTGGFMTAPDDGQINLTVYVGDEYAELPFMFDAVNAIERRFPDLEEYADTRTILADIAIGITRMADARYSCKAIATTHGRNLNRNRTRLERVIAEIADEISPMFDAAVASGDLP